MALGKLTLLCFNLICVGAVSLLLFWLLMHIQVRRKRRPRVYSVPRLQRKNSIVHAWRDHEGDAYLPERGSRVEV